MRPVTPASYALVLLLALDVALLVVRVVFLVQRQVPDPVLTTMLESTIVSTVGALVYAVHRDGSPR